MSNDLGTKETKAAFSAIVALAEAIRDLKEIPSGHLYAKVMAHMDLQTYNSFIDRLVGAKVVKRRGDLLVWVGPEKEES